MSSAAMSSAAMGHTPGTSPTTGMPPGTGAAVSGSAPAVPQPYGPSPRAKLIRRLAAAAVVLFFAVGGVLQYRAHQRAVARSMNAEALRHIDAAEEALWNVDLDRVRSETEIARKLDPKSPFVPLLRAVATTVDPGVLSRIDKEVAIAKSLASAHIDEHRMVVRGGDHHQALVELLWSFDTTDAAHRLLEHRRQYGCVDPIEPQLFATRMLLLSQNPDVLEPLFALVQLEPVRPLTAMGLARIARYRGDFTAARKILTDQLEHSDARMLVDELVDVELGTGHPEVAEDLLAQQWRKDRNDLRALGRLAHLRAKRDDWTTYAQFMTAVESLEPGDPRRVDGLSVAALQTAALGHMQQAHPLWERSYSEAMTSGDRERAGEIASLVTFFWLMQEQRANAKQWLTRAREDSLYMGNTNSKERTELFNLGSAVVMSENEAERASARQGLEVLKQRPHDVPVVLPQVESLLLLREGDFAGAAEVSQALPPCSRDLQIASIRLAEGFALKGKRAPPADVDAALAKAADLLRAATAEEAEPRCVLGANVQPWLASVSLGNAMARLATLEMGRGQREGARAAVARFRSFWRSPDADLPAARAVAAVDAWLSGAAAPQVMTPARP
jgi:hypothetical protein